jgi:hypothetical protein
VAWVARTNNLARAAAASPVYRGLVEPMARGDLTWKITVPSDGLVPLGGAAPLLIQWESGPHPADRLPDDGLALVRLAVVHPDADVVKGILAALEFAGPVTVSRGDRPLLSALVATPGGDRWL